MPGWKMRETGVRFPSAGCASCRKTTFSVLLRFDVDRGCVSLQRDSPLFAKLLFSVLPRFDVDVSLCL